MSVLLAVVSLAAHAKPVDVGIVFADGETLYFEQQFDVSDGERAETFRMWGEVQILAGGPAGEVPMHWRFVDLHFGDDGPSRPPRSFDLSFTVDGSPAHDWDDASQGILSDELTRGVLTDQLRLLPSGRRGKRETWNDTVPSAFFGGPLELTWTMGEVTGSTATVSVVGAGSALHEKLKIGDRYSMTGAIVIDRSSQLPIRSEARWTMPSEGRTIRLHVVRTLSTTPLVPSHPGVTGPTVQLPGPSPAIAALDGAMPGADGRWTRDRAEVVARFREARASSGPSFDQRILPVLGTNLERHYWSASFLTARDYLQGDPADPALALRITERALALVPMLPRCDDRLHMETQLRHHAARFAQDIGWDELATQHKSRFEALLATEESAAEGSVPAIYDDERARFDAIPVRAVPPVLVHCDAQPDD